MWWMALAAAVAGGASYLWSSYKNQKEIERQRGQAQKEYDYQKQYNDAAFNLQREESLESLGIQRNRLAQAFDTDLEGFNLGLEAQAYRAQDARIGLADSAGMALAQQGASGVRGSDTLQRRIDYAQTSFDRQLDLQDRGNSLTARDIAAQYTNSFNDIGREIDSWNPGGYRYRAKELGDVYGERMFGLRTEEYDFAYKDAGFDIMDFLGATLGGAAAGAGFGGQIDSLIDQSGKSGLNTAGQNTGQNTGQSGYGNTNLSTFFTPSFSGGALPAAGLDKYTEGIWDYYEEKNPLISSFNKTNSVSRLFSYSDRDLERMLKFGYGM